MRTPSASRPDLLQGAGAKRVRPSWKAGRRNAQGSKHRPFIRIGGHVPPLPHPFSPGDVPSPRAHADGSRTKRPFSARPSAIPETLSAIPNFSSAVPAVPSVVPIFISAAPIFISAAPKTHAAMPISPALGTKSPAAHRIFPTAHPDFPSALRIFDSSPSPISTSI